ncbi:MAG: fibronectin type III domain-containing protein, partial [Candidatus Falkowbacteria bacterium]
PNGNNVTCTIPDGTNWATMYVRAYNATGDSANSNSVARTTELCVPTDVSINSTGCRNLSVSWNDVSVSNTSYNLHFTDAAGGAHNFDVIGLGGGATSWVNNAMAFDGVDWTVTVEAVRAGFASAVSAPASRTTAVCVPTGFTATIDDCDSVSFTWTDNSSNEQGYRVYGQNLDAGGTVLLCSAGVDSESVTCNGVRDGVNWTFYVRAYNITGESGSSNTVNNATQLCVPTGLGLLTNYSCATHKAEFRWTDNSVNETGFILQKSTAGAGVWFDTCVKAANQTQCLEAEINQMILDGYDFDFRVEIHNADFTGNSDIFSISWELCIPTMISVRSDNCNHLYAEWQDNSINEDATRVYREDTDTGAASGVLCQVPGSGVYDFGGIYWCEDSQPAFEETNWNVSAQALDDTPPVGTHDSLTSNVLSAYTIICPPEAPPSDVSAVPASCQRMDVSWQDTTIRETYFLVDRDMNDGNGWQVVCDIDSAPHQRDAGTYFSCLNINIVPEEGRHINFRIAACNTTGCSASSAPDTIGITPLCAPTGFATTSAGCNNMNYSWTDETHNEDNGFRVEKRNLDTGDPWEFSCAAGAMEAAGAETGQTQTCSDNGMIDGTYWDFRARAENADIVSDWTNMSPGALTILCAPTNLGSTEINCLSDYGDWLFEISWTNNSQTNDGYEIYRNTVGVWTYLAPLIVPRSITSVFKLVDVDSTWDYRVRAFKDGIASSSWLGDIALSAGPYCSPRSLTVDAVSCECITLSWNIEGDTSSIDHFDVLRDIYGNPYGADIIDQVIGSTTPAVMTFDDCNVISDVGAYVYTIVAQNDGLKSADVVVSNPCPTLPVWQEVGY